MNKPKRRKLADRAKVVGAISPQNKNGQTGWKQILLGSVIILGLVFMVYSPVIRGEFLWDDLSIYIDRPVVTSSNALEIVWLKTVWLTTDFPMTITSFWLEYRLWGKNPTGYHVTNIVLHALNSVLLWRLLLRLKIRGAFLAALIFAVHPVCVGSVAWISERKNTLSLVFFLLSLLFFVRSQESGVRSQKSESSSRLFYFCSLVAFLFGLLSKTSIVALPIVLLGMAWWQQGKIGKKDLLRSIPFFLLALGFGLLTIYAQGHGAIRGAIVQTETFPERLAESAWAVWFYLWKTVFPINLMAIYPRWELQNVSLATLLPLFLLAGLFFFLWTKRKSWGRPPLLALGFFVVMLFPILGFFDMFFLTYSRVADQGQYVPLIGIIVFTASSSVYLSEKFNAGRNTKMILAVAIVALLSILTWNHAKVYASEEKLWSDTLQKNPKAWIAYNSLGNIRYNEGKLDQAIELFNQSLAVKENHAETHNKLAVALSQKGRLGEAMEHYATALRLEPNHAEAHSNLATALAMQGDFKNALEHFRAACRLNPNLLASANSLAWILAAHPDAKFRNGAEAVIVAQRAVELSAQKDAGILETLAAAHAEAGQFAEAIKVAIKAIDVATAAGDRETAGRIAAQLEQFKIQQPLRDTGFVGH